MSKVSWPKAMNYMITVSTVSWTSAYQTNSTWVFHWQHDVNKHVFPLLLFIILVTGNCFRGDLSKTGVILHPKLTPTKRQSITNWSSKSVSTYLPTHPSISPPIYLSSLAPSSASLTCAPARDFNNSPSQFLSQYMNIKLLSWIRKAFKSFSPYLASPDLTPENLPHRYFNSSQITAHSWISWFLLT